MAPIAASDLTYYPAPFPDHVPQIELQRISVKDLFDGNEAAAAKTFDIFCNSGFFYLDLTTDPRGQGFDDAANQLHDAAKDIFGHIPIEEKETWKGNPLQGFLDTGYRALAKDETGQPTEKGELLNVPSYDILNDSEYKLPTWLEPYRHAYKSFAHHGDLVGQAIFQNLERQLHLPAGQFTTMFRLSKETGGFVRLFRQPAIKSGVASDIPIGPAHTDGNALTMLFNWQGGLQIARPNAASRGIKMIDGANAEEEWLWLKPIPGHAIVNLGDPMVTFSNGLLTSGRHRVMTPPGEQAKHHRYSLLMGMRPASTTLMRALKSDVIPPETEEQKQRPDVTALDWAIAKVKAIMERAAQNKA